MKNMAHMISHILLTVFILSQIIAFIIYSDYGTISSLKIAGMFSWTVSAVLGWLPIYVFRKIGGVKKGSSYVKTTKMVTTGIYSIVRHPQYLAGIFLSLAFMLISQHWIVVVLGIPFMIILYIGGIDEDRALIKKFGKEYEDYMKSVPRFNILLGIIRKIGK